jgi:hypothetical protein
MERVYRVPTNLFVYATNREEAEEKSRKCVDMDNDCLQYCETMTAEEWD